MKKGGHLIVHSRIETKGKYSSNQIDEEISVYSNDNSDTVINNDDVEMQKEVLEEKENEEKNKMNVEEEKNEIF